MISKRRKKCSISSWFISGCTDNDQCIYQADEGVCDTFNQMCIGKVHLLRMTNYYKLNSFCLLLGCTNDSQCTYEPNKSICDTEKMVCVGKLHCLLQKTLP